MDVNRRVAAVAALERRLGHRFSDRALLERALTHASASDGARKSADNERLEFLGDRVLGLIVADELMRRDAEGTAGALSKRLSALVNRQACARSARTLGVGPALRLHGGETRRGGRDHETILADACEAIIAAVYLETGYDTASRLVLALWASMLDEPVDPLADPKSALQEWAAAEGRAAPCYRLVTRTGPDHQPQFEVEVVIAGDPPSVGVGGSLQAAQKAAARSLLLRHRGAP